jgi:hypothetical protein
LTFLSGHYGVAVYDATSGDVISPGLVTGLNGPIDLAVVGNDLFIADNPSGIISEYDATSGSDIAPNFITGLNAPDGMAAAAPTPEPGSFALLVWGAAALACRRRRGGRFH